MLSSKNWQNERRARSKAKCRWGEISRRLRRFSVFPSPAQKRTFRCDFTEKFKMVYVPSNPCFQRRCTAWPARSSCRRTVLRQNEHAMVKSVHISVIICKPSSCDSKTCRVIWTTAKTVESADNLEKIRRFWSLFSALRRYGRRL